MTDAHCHILGDADRHFICLDPTADLPSLPSLPFIGVHPWNCADFGAAAVDAMRRVLEPNPRVGVGEIGLDRLKCRDISQTMRDAFAAQLGLAAEFRRPVVLHGAKCWGEVVGMCRPFANGAIPAFLFHGFSRSSGLLGEIAAMNGFVSIGPAILNDHAVNYRRLAAEIPEDILLVETDRTEENSATIPSIYKIVDFLAHLRGVPAESLAARLEANADRFALT